MVKLLFHFRLPGFSARGRAFPCNFPFSFWQTQVVCTLWGLSTKPLPRVPYQAGPSLLPLFLIPVSHPGLHFGSGFWFVREESKDYMEEKPVNPFSHGKMRPFGAGVG